MLKNLKKSKKLLGFLIAGILIIPAVWALFVPGFYGASDDIHIGWLFEFHKTLMMGQIPPRFVPDLSFGFGYPLFNFVFPLPFYIAEIIHLFLGFNLVDSIKALFFLTIPLSGLFMYFLLREYSGRSFSLAGAVLYIYTPYRSVDLYIRGAIGEIVSFVFLPLILLSVIKLSKTRGLKWVGIGAISLASLVLSHNITGYMFFPFVALLFLFQTFFISAKKQFITNFFLMIFLGLLISIYFWLPAIVDSNLMKYDTVFNFVDHFPTISQLITPYWGYGASVPGPYDGMSFFLGITNLLVLGIGIISIFLFWKKIEKEKRIIFIWSLICISWSMLLMNYRSIFIWSIVPMLPYFQFPWRFLILTTFAIPILIIILEKLPFNKFIPAVLIVLTLVTSGSYFRPQDFLGRKDDYFLNRYIPSPVASDEYKKTQEEYLRLPIGTQVRPDKIYPRVTNNTNIKEVVSTDDLNAQIKVESDKGAVISYNKYSFPGWEVRIDNQVVEHKTGSPFGQLTFFVPSGQHMIEVSFKEGTFKKILDAISLVAFLVSLRMAWTRLKKYGPSS